MKKMLIVLVIALAFGACKTTGSALSQTHKVRFINNYEGSVGLTSVEMNLVFHGEKLSEPPDPAWPGHVFEGWYTDNGSFANLYDFSKPLTGDLQLYAKWKAAEQT